MGIFLLFAQNIRLTRTEINKQLANRLCDPAEWRSPSPPRTMMGSRVVGRGGHARDAREPVAQDGTVVPGPAAAVEDHELGAVANVRLLIHSLSLFGYPSLQLRVMRRARLRGGWHSVVLPFEVGARPSTNNVARDVRHHEGQKDLEEEEHVLEHDGNP